MSLEIRIGDKKLDPLHLEIIEEEALYPRALIEVPASVEVKEGAEVVIIEEGALLFKGVLLPHPKRHGLETVLLEAISWHEIPTVSPLPEMFQNRGSLKQALSITPQVPFYSREDAPACLSFIDKGERAHDLGTNYFSESFKLWRAHIPAREARVTLKASWSQELEGTFEAGEKINQQFEAGLMSTYTPEALIKSWPKVGDLKGTGYELIASSLNEIKPAPGLYPVAPGKRWFRPTLKFLWQLKQKRQEHFTLHYQNALPAYLQKIAPATQSMHTLLMPETRKEASYFITNHGKEAAQVARQMAYTSLRASNRCVRVQVETHIRETKAYTLKDEVRLRYGDREYQGKLIKLTLRWCGGRGDFLAKLLLGVSSYTVREKILPGYQHQKPETELLSPLSMIEAIDVKNPPEQQARKLREGESLEDSSTQLKVRFKSLKSTGILDHQISVYV